MVDAGLRKTADGEDCRVQVDRHQPAEQSAASRTLHEKMRAGTVEGSDASGIGRNGVAQARVETGLTARDPILIRRDAHDALPT